MSRKAVSMTPSAIRKREKYWEAKKAKLESLSEPTDTPIETPLNNADAIEIDVVPNETPKPSLKDRLFGGNSPLPGAPTKAKMVKKGQRGKQIDASLLAKTFPTLVATTAAGYAQRLIKDPYKPCAPTQQEVYSTIAPLFSILSRRIEIVGTASEDIIDVITAVLAGLVTGIRIHITYLSISEAVEKARLNGHATNAHGGISDTSAARTNAAGNGTQFDTSEENLIPTGYVGRQATNASNGHASAENGDSIDAKPEAQLFAELANRDRSGRARLGLL